VQEGLGEFQWRFSSEITPVVDRKGRWVRVEGAVEDRTVGFPLVVKVNQASWGQMEEPNEGEQGKVEDKVEATLGVFNKNIHEFFGMLVSGCVVAVLVEFSEIFGRRVTIEPSWGTDSEKTADLALDGRLNTVLNGSNNLGDIALGSNVGSSDVADSRRYVKIIMEESGAGKIDAVLVDFGLGFKIGV
jgi:hypothetical protein